jgi:hypothetical protein
MMASQYGFLTQQERDEEKKKAAEDEAVLRAKRRQVADATVQDIGPLIRASVAEYFRSMGLSTVDDTGAEQVALFEEKNADKGHIWRAWSQIKTGTHSDYRADGVHVLDELTAYSITVSLVVSRDGAPLLYVGDYVRSKLVGGTPVPASDFALEIPSRLTQALENKTGIKLVDRVKFLNAQDN